MKRVNETIRRNNRARFFFSRRGKERASFMILRVVRSMRSNFMCIVRINRGLCVIFWSIDFCSREKMIVKGWWKSKQGGFVFLAWRVRIWPLKIFEICKNKICDRTIFLSTARCAVKFYYSVDKVRSFCHWVYVWYSLVDFEEIFVASNIDANRVSSDFSGKQYRINVQWLRIFDYSKRFASYMPFSMKLRWALITDREIHPRLLYADI